MTESANSNENQISLLEKLRLLDRNPDWRRDLPDLRAKDLSKQFDSVQNALKERVT